VPIAILPELLDDETTPWGKIIYNEDTDKRMVTDGTAPV
jgi:hypothetical protein